ncbi:MAG TPA: hypothetical protein VFN79_03630 [Steroidobacteraceae bacterium]|nr:hypothetical protein [Steroidobacteraceae bacterium]
MPSASTSPTPPDVVARSALLQLTATASDGSLALRVTRLANHQLITGAGKVTASLDGHRVPLTPEPNGTYLLSLHGSDGGKRSLSVVVAHDGIRELLTGTVSLPRQRSMLDSLEGHGMAAWWVLNIAVILIAVLVISRHRK